MKVGLLSSYRTICGIAEYTGHLARGLKRAGADVVVLGSRNEGHRNLPPDPATSGIPWLPVFDVEAWRTDGAHGLDVDAILDQGLDVLHVQYEVILFHRQRLQELLDRFDGVKAITWHDSCIPPDMPGPWDVEFTHREGVGPFKAPGIMPVGARVLPMGVESVPPLVRTFGLGRSREDIICAICDRHGWRFDASFGDRRWLNEGDLHAWLREADLLVLWYPDVDSAGSSLAARTALATGRPLIVNDVTWFRDLPTTAKRFRKVPDDPAALAHAMEDHFVGELRTADTWDQVADRHLQSYLDAAGRVEAARLRAAQA